MKTIGLKGSHIQKGKTYALLGHNAKIDGALSLANTRIYGPVDFNSACISGHLVCWGASFNSKSLMAFDGYRLDLKGTLIWAEFKTPPIGTVCFAYASAGELCDDLSSWPDQEGALIIDGFSYGGLSGPKTPTHADSRLKWLSHMDKSRFIPQPYEHLAKVLKEMGYTVDARKVLIAKQDREQIERQRKGRTFAHAWHSLLGITTAYGYEPWRVFIPMALIILFGAGIFYAGFGVDVMQPSKERIYISECVDKLEPGNCTNWQPLERSVFKVTHNLPKDYPAFNALIYSLDTFLPIVDLHQENYWLPNAGKRAGGSTGATSGSISRWAGC